MIGSVYILYCFFNLFYLFLLNRNYQEKTLDSVKQNQLKIEVCVNRENIYYNIILRYVI